MHFFGPKPPPAPPLGAQSDLLPTGASESGLETCDSAAAPTADKGDKPWQAALLLFFLAPAMARLFSAALSPAEYFSPIIFLGLHASLGAAAVLLREWAVRRRIGAWGRLLLGLALGLFYEGLVTRNLFAAESGELGTLVGYGRALGVNWLWGMLSLAFHATQSFLLPLLFVDVLLPQYRSAPALSRRAAVWLSLLAGLSALIGFIGISANIGDPGQVYHPGLLALLLTLSGVLGLPWLAARLARHAAAAPAVHSSTAPGPGADLPPAGETIMARQLALRYALQAGGGGLSFRQRGEPPLRPSPRALGWLVGLGTALLLFILPALFKDLFKLPDAATFLVCLSGLGAALWLAQRLSGRLAPAHQFALLAGSQACWMLLCLLLPLDDGLRPDETLGMQLLPLLSGCLLLLSARRLRRRVPAAGPQARVLPALR